MNSHRGECVTAVTGGGGSEADFWDFERYVIIGRSLSSWLKTFYDHLRGYRDNLKFLIFSYFSYSYISICAGNVSNAGN